MLSFILKLWTFEKLISIDNTVVMAFSLSNKVNEMQKKKKVSMSQKNLEDCEDGASWAVPSGSDSVGPWTEA